MNIAIINCRNTTKTCTASSCLMALNLRNGNFEQYSNMEITLMACTDCGGCEDLEKDELAGALLKKRLARFNEISVEKIHLGVCVNAQKCVHYQEILNHIRLSNIAYELGTHKQ